MKFLWSNYRNKMKPELIGSELKVKVNTQVNCTELYDYHLNDQDLLKQIRSSDKYIYFAKIIIDYLLFVYYNFVLIYVNV